MKNHMPAITATQAAPMAIHLRCGVGFAKELLRRLRLKPLTPNLSRALSLPELRAGENAPKMWRVFSPAAGLTVSKGDVEAIVTGSGDIGGRNEAASAQAGDKVSNIRVDRPIALVGLMGAGKTTIGRRLAQALKLKFVDADAEIEQAARMRVSEIFAKHGEADFRRGERSVIARLLSEPPHVLATGGGAFIDPETRAMMKEKAISIWLKAPLDVLMRRVERRDDRPLLHTEDPRAVMQALMDKRYPIYAEADVIVDSTNSPHNAAVAAVLDALRDYLAGKA